MCEIFAILQNVTAKIAETGKFTLTDRTGGVNFAAGEFRRSDGFEHVKTGTVTVTAKSISSASNARGENGHGGDAAQGAKTRQNGSTGANGGQNEHAFDMRDKTILLDQRV